MTFAGTERGMPIVNGEPCDRLGNERRSDAESLQKIFLDIRPLFAYNQSVYPAAATRSGLMSCADAESCGVVYQLVNTDPIMIPQARVGYPSSIPWDRLGSCPWIPWDFASIWWDLRGISAAKSFVCWDPVVFRLF